MASGIRRYQWSEVNSGGFPRVVVRCRHCGCKPAPPRYQEGPNVLVMDLPN